MLTNARKSAILYKVNNLKTERGRIMDSEDSGKSPRGPSWSVVVLVIGPEGKTISRGISSSVDNQLRKLPNGENTESDGTSPRKTAVRILKDETGLNLHISQFELKGKRNLLKNGYPHILFMFEAKVSNFDEIMNERQKKIRNKDGFKFLDLKSITATPDFSQGSLSNIKTVYPRKLNIRKN
jgi:ADP-ribose pyrophosphatase YjhB (NUDIX family)